MKREMPLDAICLTAIKNELAESITGSKIEKIQQPERDLIILSLRNTGNQSHRLLISAGSGDSRVHITGHKFDNPQAPPMFCMLLRKHLTGARVIDISQPSAERVLVIKLESINTFGERVKKRLIIELIGRQTNIILIDSDDIIVDCLRRIGGELNEKRSVLPGLLYRTPPIQEEKLNPLNITSERLSKLLLNAKDEPIEKWLISTFAAFSPLICREIAWRAYGDTDFRIGAINDDGEALLKAFLSLLEQVNSNEFEPWLISSDDGKPLDFSYTHIRQYETKYSSKRESSFSYLLDVFFTLSGQQKRINRKSAVTIKVMTNARDRQVRKLIAQKSEYEETSNRDYLRECGDLITANLHSLRKGQLFLAADDFFTDNSGVREIKLDALKTPQQNAAKYYKAYTKAKNARSYLSEQIQNGERELDYIESVIEQLKRVENEQEINEIRNELSQTGYIKPPRNLGMFGQQRQKVQGKQQKGRAQKKAKSRHIESTPHRFSSSSGFRIYAGKNNVQNDTLTLKSAARSDIWLHAQKIHGSHVIISCAGSSPDDATLKEAASIAAYYSAARNDGKVPVDYTPVKNVKKPSGGRPGMVIYNDFKTILAVPDEELVKRLRDEQ
jgi:predicted ribosome quality control (RQC) complex YloA/Tae2 family protein